MIMNTAAINRFVIIISKSNNITIILILSALFDKLRIADDLRCAFRKKPLNFTGNLKVK